MSSKRTAVISEGLRTAIGRATKGSLAQVRPDDTAAEVIKTLVERTGLEGALVEDVIIGCATPEAEQGVNVARRVAMLSGLPASVPGMTISRYCGSSVEAVALAASRIESGWSDLMIAGGLESMSMAPMGGLHPPKTENPRYTKLLSPMPPANTLLQTAQYLAEVNNITREEQDRFALDSQQKAVASIDEGLLEDRIVPIEIKDFDGSKRNFKVDECPRRNVSMEKLASLPTIVRPITSKTKEPTITAGNSCPLNDAAAAMIVVEQIKAHDLGLKPLATIRSVAVAGVPPHEMGAGPVPATRKALEKAGLTADDIDLIELNEAFASQCIYTINELNLDPAKVNVHGGAIAFGHPLGATGAILIIRLVRELERRDLNMGLVTMCVADGQGIAMVLERTT